MSLSNITTTTPYGEDPTSPADIILFTPHDGGQPYEDKTQKYIDKYQKDPSIQSAFKHSLQTWIDFCHLEKDDGSTEWAHATAQQLTEQSDGRIRTDVFGVEEDRGRIDANRIAEYRNEAIRPIFDSQSKFYQELTAESLEIHAHIIAALQSQIAAVLANNFLRTKYGLRPGFQPPQIMDMHTMWAYTPKQRPALNPDNIPEYIHAVTDPAGRAERRKINILARTSPNTPSLSQPDIEREFFERIKASGRPIEFDHPYSLVPKVLSTQFLRGNGLVVDVPVDAFSTYPAEDPRYNDLRPELSKSNIEEIAKITAASFLAAIKAGRKQPRIIV